MITKHCLWCDKEFETVQKNKIYCSAECRELATREKITQRYILAKRKKRIDKIRLCAGGCGTMLSIYNDSRLCTNCLVNHRKYNAFLKELREMTNEEN